jgi:hypothetical protein
MRTPRPDSAPGSQAAQQASGAIRIAASTTDRATTADGHGAGQLTMRAVASARNRPGQIQPHQAITQHNQQQGRSGSAHRPPPGRPAADGRDAGQLAIRTVASARDRPGQIQQYQVIPPHDQQQRSGSAHRPTPMRRHQTDKVLARW